MSYSIPKQPTFAEHDESDALPSDAIAAAELDDLRNRRVYAARLGCVLHILHIVVTAGMTSTFLLESLRRARVAEAPKARLDLFLGADFFSGGGEEVVSMATPETMTKRRFLTHPCSTVAYAMRVMFFVPCALKPKKVYSNLRFSVFEATPPSGQGT